MKITNVETFYLRLPEILERSASCQDTLLVKITTDDGIVGWGEIDSLPLASKAIIEAPMSHAIMTGLKRLLIDEDPFQITYLWHKMHQKTLYHGRSGAVIHTMAGIDLALWDIKGKALKVPVWRLLGGRFFDRLPVYSSNMFQFSAEETADRARQAQDSGYKAVKFGWEPFGRDPKMDVAYLKAIREAVGQEMDIMLDVGLVWDAKTTIQRCHLFEPFNLFWVEEPLPPGDLRGYALVSQSVETRIAAGEEECTVDGFLRLMDEGRIDIVQIDVTRCGLTQAMIIAQLADQRGLKIANHNFTTDINTAASLHFLASNPNSLILEYCVEPSEITRHLALDPIQVIDGYAKVPDEPGLGIEPNPRVIEKYLVP